MIQLEERLYTSTEVAEILGVSLRSVYRYLEEGKLDAEIKTATGRHRFSKKNIIDFLYPSGDTAPRTVSETPQVRETTRTHTIEETEVSRGIKSADFTTPQPKAETIPQPVAEPVNVAPVEPNAPVEPVVPEEPVDWLAKFREAAKKFREESETVETSETTPEPVVEEPRHKINTDAFPGFSGATSEPIRETVSTKALFYRSSLGGLKDIAQNIDKTSRSAGVPYAFSMNAGLSLYKPIKPFSVLHAYVKPQDLPFFERVLGLTPSEESGSQLCLYVSSDTGIFANREEMHGLFVVSKKKLLEDITKTGDATLTEEAKSAL